MRRVLTVSTMLITGFVLMLGTGHTATHGKNDTDVRLHEVRALYVEPMGHTPEHMRIDTVLPGELAAAGLPVVSRVEEADAVLVVRWAVEVSPDGEPRDNYPRDVISLVVRTRDGERVWFGTVILFARTHEQATLAYKARRLVAAVENAWRHSARR